MTAFVVADPIVLQHADTTGAPCYAYAVAELRRILGRLGRVVTLETQVARIDGFSLCLVQRAGAPPLRTPPLDGMMPDGYILRVSADGVVLSSATEKGVLNAVYDLAERLGVLFLLPGLDGEWMPEGGVVPRMSAGEWRVNPRFKHRGVFWDPCGSPDYTVEEWLRFFAKLRFNAVSHDIKDLPVARELGIRLEVGGHGLASLLPRDLFAEKPELFRLFQPEDFGGKRNPDSNLCVTNPEAARIVQQHYLERLEATRGAYAVHAWADDLPAGGWCLCSSCRALEPSDQAMLAMRYMGETLARTGLPMRVPVIAYHDTMMPGNQIAPPREGFLLFAPRERCYGHRLDDPSCARNRFYLAALKAWTRTFAGIDDAHTFEYYFDQILFRGLHPFLPAIILGDMQTYAAHGIESHMSLQVGGPAISPEFNMLVFARGQWQADLTPAAFMADLGRAICHAASQPWVTYLTRRAEIYAAAMRMCGHNVDIYLDYRWLPETTDSFGREMAAVYADAATQLAEAAGDLEAALQPAWPERVRRLVRQETGRARFEAVELAVMAKQQQAMNGFGEFMTTRDPAVLEKAVAALEQAVLSLAAARDKALAAGLPPEAWYYGNINGWLTKEFSAKIARYRQWLAQA